MNICQEHWDRLRAAVEARGMSHLVARSGQEAAANTVEQMEEGVSPDNWDPLMAAFVALGSKGLERCGMAAFAPGFCFLCEVRKSFEHCKTLPEFDPDLHKDDDFWLNSCMDAMLEHAREIGLMPRVS
jgi:hypothetical protein